MSFVEELRGGTSKPFKVEPGNQSRNASSKGVWRETSTLHFLALLTVLNWETLVKTVKKILYFQQWALKNEYFQSFIAEKGAILNNRSLASVNDNPNDLTVLAPISLCNRTIDSSLLPDILSRSMVTGARGVRSAAC